jgi:Spy/CpxP family protein refolding chaperone
MNRIASRLALLSLALSIASVVPVVFAQNSGVQMSPDHGAAPLRAPDPQRQAERLAKRLGLSSDQTAKIASILQSRQQQVAVLRSDNSLAPQDRRAKQRSIQQDADTQINAVLTPDQQKQYATMKENMKDRWKNMHGAANSAGSSNGGSDSDSY